MAPSIATSSTTAVGDHPIKAKTYPQPGQPFDNSVFHDHEDDSHYAPKPHVMFADTAGLDGEDGNQNSTISPAQRDRMMAEGQVTGSPASSRSTTPCNT
jgi:hypothetical protein